MTDEPEVTEAAPAPEIVNVAILDQQGFLIGSTEKPKSDLLVGEIISGDLPCDSSYFHDGDKFVPKGFGQGKPRRAQFTRDHVFYMFMKAVIEKRDPPKEVTDWLAWFERHGQ